MCMRERERVCVSVSGCVCVYLGAILLSSNDMGRKI